MLALTLMSFGTGCLKPCLLTFGGDQFKLPEQTAQMNTYFSLFYMTLKGSLLVAAVIMPMLRSGLHCFGRETCFLVAFAVSSVSALIAFLCFLLGKPTYAINPSSKNVLIKIVQCVYVSIMENNYFIYTFLMYIQIQQYAITNRSSRTTKLVHWLDKGLDHFEPSIVQDAKVLLNMLLLFVPIPLYWALSEQVGSRFTIQATGMNGSLMGFYTIQPDQFQVIHTSLVLIFVPLNDAYLYRCWARIGIRRPLQKMCVGGILCVQSKLQTTYAVVPAVAESHLRLFNGMPCAYRIESQVIPSRVLPALERIEALVPMPTIPLFKKAFVLHSQDPQRCRDLEGQFTIASERSYSYFVSNDEVIEYEDSAVKSLIGLGVLTVLKPINKTLKIVDAPTNEVVYQSIDTKPARISLHAGDYSIYVENEYIANRYIESGTVETLLVEATSWKNEQTQKTRSLMFEISPPNTMHMLWLMPQYLMLSMSDAMFAVPGLAFTYAQAPKHMKTVMQATWLLMLSFGNAIDMVVVSVHMFKSQVMEFLAFACFLYVDMAIFMWLARRYKRIE